MKGGALCMFARAGRSRRGLASHGTGKLLHEFPATSFSLFYLKSNSFPVS